MKNLTYLEFKNELPMLRFTDLFSLSSYICSSLADAEDVKMSKPKYSPSRSSQCSGRQSVVMVAVDHGVSVSRFGLTSGGTAQVWKGA